MASGRRLAPTTEEDSPTTEATQQTETAEADETAETETTEAESTYAYEGPEYEIVAVDEDQGPAELDRFWVFTEAQEYSTPAYQDLMKRIITDIAVQEGSANLIVEVVTHEEVIEAESASTIAGYMQGHDGDYLRDVLGPLEAEHWVGSYTGGFDPGSYEASDSPDAYEIIWFPAATPEFETWQPSTGA